MKIEAIVYSTVCSLLPAFSTQYEDRHSVRTEQDNKITDGWLLMAVHPITHLSHTGLIDLLNTGVANKNN